MEKRKPHIPLTIVKSLVKEGRVSFTKSALIGAAALGFDSENILAIVMSLKGEYFYKSMTTHADHKVWQDVYHFSTEEVEVYLKLTVTDDLLIVSFKER